MAVLAGPYQDVVPGSKYPIAMQVKGTSGTPFTGKTVKLTLDPASPTATAVRLEKTITSFGLSSGGVTDGLASVVLTEAETAAMGLSPGAWKVLWQVDDVAYGPIRELAVTPMPKGDV